METQSPFAHSARSARGDAAAAGSSSRRTVLAAASMAAVLLLPACGTSPSRGRRGAAPSYAYSRLTPEQSSDIAIHAMGLVGTPYRYGGNTPEGGFDCSGLIGYVYRSLAGIPPPRTVAQLSDFGAPVEAGDERTGDLVIFGSGRPTHAGIVVEGGRFVHAPSTGGTVKLDRFSSGYWSRQPIAFRRP